MSSIFLSPEVLSGIFLDFLVLLIFTYALFQAIFILKTSKEEKKLYLFSTLVRIAFITKVLLLVFFTYTLDEISTLINGAMCATGVVDSNEYGAFAFGVKLGVIVALALWLRLGERSFRVRASLFIGLYVFILLEFILLITFYAHIDTNTVASCCSMKYVSDSNPLPFDSDIETLVSLFFVFSIFVVLSIYKKSRVFLVLSSSIFLYLSYYVLVYYFGASIYGDATHKCPFCMLKQEYYFLGYFIYASALFFIYFILSFIININDRHTLQRAQIALCLFILLISISFIITKVLLR